MDGKSLPENVVNSSETKDEWKPITFNAYADYRKIILVPCDVDRIEIELIKQQWCQCDLLRGIMDDEQVGSRHKIVTRFLLKELREFV